MPQNKQSHRKTGRLADVVSLILGIVLVFALLQVFGSLKGDRLVFPGVGEILKAFGRLLISGHTYLLIGTTLRHLMLALLFSTVIGVGIGLLEGMFDVVWHLFRPLMILLRSIPMIVLIVIIMVLTKYERVPVIATTLVLVPLISEATNEGCRGIDQDLIDVYRMNSSLIRFKKYLKIFYFKYRFHT